MDDLTALEHLEPFCACGHDRGHHAPDGDTSCGAWAGPGCCPCPEYAPRAEGS